MDFPAFHLDLFGDRLMIAVIAILHVFVNHALAVGAMPFITLMAWWGYRTGNKQWDNLAHRILGVCFVVTTSVGALTGVGIWFSASLANPYAIGSLIRVFFWGWFIEWVVFVTEVVLIMIFYLTWKKWGAKHKLAHIWVGVVLSAASWATMAIIVAILGFMMDTGTWVDNQTFLTGVFNPIYIPQLMFRTPYALLAAGLFSLLLVFFFTERGSDFRAKAVRFCSTWSLVWIGPCLGGGWLYWQVVPTDMADNLGVALATQAYAIWDGRILQVLLLLAITVAIVSLWGLVKPRKLPRVALIVPFVCCIMLLGYFERIREFVRKPWVIEGYMYANGIRADDYPVLARHGVLREATYVTGRDVTEETMHAAGKDMWIISCSRCHTTDGVNGMVAKLTNLYGSDPWESEIIVNYMNTMHKARPYMPPVPGTDDEKTALAHYLISLQTAAPSYGGAQREGVKIPPVPGAEEEADGSQTAMLAPANKLASAQAHSAGE
jgi:cytochrome c553